MLLVVSSTEGRWKAVPGEPPALRCAAGRQRCSAPLQASCTGGTLLDECGLRSSFAKLEKRRRKSCKQSRRQAAKHLAWPPVAGVRGVFLRAKPSPHNPGIAYPKPTLWACAKYNLVCTWSRTNIRIQTSQNRLALRKVCIYAVVLRCVISCWRYQHKGVNTNRNRDFCQLVHKGKALPLQLSKSIKRPV